MKKIIDLHQKYEILKNILSKNFVVSQKSNEKEILIKCPYCNDKNDEYHMKTGHFHMYINVDNGSYHCFLCNKSGHDIKQFIRENKSKFSTEDIIILSKLYYFDTSSNKNYVTTIIKNDNNIKQYIDYFYNEFKTKQGLDYLYKRIYIKENDNKEYLTFLIKNKIIFPFLVTKKVKECKKIKESFNTIIYKNNFGYMIPFTFYSGFQLHYPNNQNRYIIYSKKDEKTINILVLKGTSNNVYITEGVFDGLKLWNILDRKDTVIITFGKTNVSSILLAIKNLQYNYQTMIYYFAFDNDIEYSEYLKLIKRFKQGYNLDIKVLLFTTNKIKDIGEMKSKNQFNKNVKIIDYNIFAIKNIYNVIRKLFE